MSNSTRRTPRAKKSAPASFDAPDYGARALELISAYIHTPRDLRSDAELGAIFVAVQLGCGRGNPVGLGLAGVQS